MKKICSECGGEFDARGRALRCYRCRGVEEPVRPAEARLTKTSDEKLLRAGVRITKDEQGRRLLILPPAAQASRPAEKCPKKPKQFMGQSLDAVLWRLAQENAARRRRGLTELSYGRFVALERLRSNEQQEVSKRKKA